MKFKLMTLLLAATALTAACDDDDNTGPEGEARVRVVHASPDAPSVDVLLDDAEVLSDVPYLAASDYLAASADDHNLKVNAAGTATTVIDADVTLADGTDYTVIASVSLRRSRRSYWWTITPRPRLGTLASVPFTARPVPPRWTSTSPRPARTSRRQCPS